jgi:hypothetical protein
MFNAFDARHGLRRKRVIDIRPSLAQAAKQSRVQHALSQTELATHMKSSQLRADHKAFRTRWLQSP